MAQTMNTPTDVALEGKPQVDPRHSLANLLSMDLDFHQDASNYASHARPGTSRRRYAGRRRASPQSGTALVGVTQRLPVVS